MRRDFCCAGGNFGLRRGEFWTAQGGILDCAPKGALVRNRTTFVAQRLWPGNRQAKGGGIVEL